MGGGRRSGLTVALALVAGALVVAPAAGALGDRTTYADSSASALDRLALAAPAPSAGEHDHADGTFANSILEAAHLRLEEDGPQARNPTLPTGFSDQKVITGLSEAVSADFAPDGTAFIALKTGQVKVAAYSGGTWGAPTDFADLQAQVNNYGDRGLTGIAVDPQFPTRPYVYVNYTYDKDPREGAGGAVPKWGTGTAYDNCPTPANENNTSIAGCIVQDRVTRLTASLQAGRWRMTGTEKELLVGGCYQFSSHASGDVAFGPDGKLYASSGEGASFNTLDHGQYADPCPGDPAGEGGSLRSQDYRTSGDPLGVDGAVFRMDPDTGVVPTQANASQWLVAYGQRNPWRLTFRAKADGTGLSKELWSADVGASKAEEVNKLADVTAGSGPVNRGWPCYEGNFQQSAVQPGWDALNLSLCETLYAQGTGAVVKPYFSYQTRDGGPLVAGEDCANETSSVSGTAFPTAASNYPAAYRNAMFFSDFARSCIWVLDKLPDGEPDPTDIRTFVQAAATPVDLLTGPGGDLYYVDYGLTDTGTVAPGGAAVHRIVYTGSNGAPTARITSPGVFSGPAPLTVSFSGATSSDPDGDALTYRWDFDGNGSWDATGVTASHQYAAGTWTARLEVDDGHGHTHVATQQVQAGNTAPVLGTTTPSTSLTWAVGDVISYSATATDQQQGTLPSSAFSWQLEIRHCPSGVCHTHPFGTFSGATGSFSAPPHEYPSHLLLTVTVTDSGGLTDTRTLQLNPKTVDLTFASVPSGASITVGEADHPAPYTETFIQKSPVTVSAAPTTGSGATVAAFGSWSDGGARSHAVTPGTSPATLTATYTRPTASLSANPLSGSAPLTVSYTAGATNAPGATGSFTYAWDLDDDGAYDDGTGATRSATYATAGSRTVRVLATDSRGATDAASVTVAVGAANRPPVPQAAATPSSGPAPLTTTLSAAGSSDPDGDPLTYAWDTDADGVYDDGSTRDVAAGYSGVGPHVATVRVSDNRGGSATKAVTVTVTNRNPVAAVAANPTSGPAPLTAQFSAAGSADPDGTALTYAWDLDDDGAYDDGTGVTASRTYSALGPHVVEVRVTDAHGGTDTDTVTVTVTNSGPTARITTTPQNLTGTAPFAVSFSGATSSDPDGQPLTYAWDLDGDGQYDDATGATTGRTYGVGVVQVGLRVTDSGGLTSTASVTVTVPNRNPTAAIAADPTTGPAPLLVGLTAAGSADPDGGSLTYAWDLDDDGAFDDATGLTTSRTFTTVGPHRVTVRVIDAAGGTATGSVTVTVTNTGPTASFTTDPVSGAGPAPLAVSFDATGSGDPDGGPVTFAWDLDGDGQYDDATTPTTARTYPVGSTVVALKVTDQHGAAATVTRTVQATNTAPTLTRVTSYPAGGFAVGQTIGFDAAASDPQQQLPDSAYSFVVQRQDCDTGCPRVEVQRLTGVQNGQVVVPELPYPSHLFVVATVTDAHGATGTAELRLDPRPAALTVRATRGFAVRVDDARRRSGWTTRLVAGSAVRVVAPKRQVRQGVRWVFVRWSDGGARRHDVTVWDPGVTVKAVYRRVR